MSVTEYVVKFHQDICGRGNRITPFRIRVDKDDLHAIAKAVHEWVHPTLKNVPLFNVVTRQDPGSASVLGLVRIEDPHETTPLGTFFCKPLYLGE